MAKTFDPSSLSPADQAAFGQWQQQLQQYVAQNGGAIPAPVSYALAHPEYLQQHPELRQDVDIVSGSQLPPTTREALKDYHPNWGGDTQGMQKNSGLWSKWETWLQIGLGAGVAAEVAPAIAAAASSSAAAPAAGGTAAATTGGTVGTGAAGAGGAAAGGTGATAAGTGASYIGSDIAGTAATSGGAAAMAPTTITGLTTPGVGAAATTPAFAAGGSTGAAAAAPSIWDRIFGKTATDKALTGIGIGANLAGSIIQSRQASKAAEAEKEAADKALALQSNIYQQQRSDLAPYRNAGASSLSALTYGLGLDPSKSADTTTPYFAQQAQAQNTAAQQTSQAQNRMPPAAPSQAVPRTSLSAISAPATNGMVAMLSPDGRPAQVPQNQVQAAIAAGGKLT